ncbi:MAG: histidinol-phosphate transaminase, partial [Alphaproteobacteria bacterium]|nr:histidinol-phosphate transaminase [Alphaproteobacteria bacterium]
SVRLRQAIAQLHDIEADRVVCGFGSDEILQLMCRAYAGPGDEVIYSEHGFLVYPIAALSAGATPVAVPDDGYYASVDNLLAAVNERTRLVFLANPNNPTGTYLPKDEVERLHAGLPDHVVLVLDGAYAEYVEGADYDPGLRLADSAPNVLMTRTFSKIYGLAALRLGWAYGPEGIIDVLNRLRGPFNVSGPAQAAGLAALDDQEFVARQREHVRRWRDVFTQRLTALGLKVVPSAANFVLIRFASDKAAADMDEALRKRGFYLRRMERYGFSDHLRLTVGTEPENEGVLSAFAELMAERA